MPGSLNKAVLIGKVDTVPEVKTFSDGGQICTFKLETSESWKDKNSGEKKWKNQYHRIVIKSAHLVKIASEHLKSGSQIYLEGQIETRKWQDQTGEDRYMTEIVLGAYRGVLTLL